MKKLISILLAAVMSVSLLAACGGKDGGESVSADPVEILNTIWKGYQAHAGEDNLFPISGGKMDAPTMDAAGEVDITDEDTLNFTLNLPSDLHSQIDKAADMVHAMNASTFTGIAYHLTSGTDAAAFAAAAADGIKNTQWICGFPEKLLVATIGEQVVVFYGADVIMNQMKTELTTAYSGAVIVADEAL